MRGSVDDEDNAQEATAYWVAWRLNCKLWWRQWTMRFWTYGGLLCEFRLLVRNPRPILQRLRYATHMQVDTARDAFQCDSVGVCRCASANLC